MIKTFKLLLIILLLWCYPASSDNPPYPCGTYQQYGKLCSDGNLYVNSNCSGYYYPKPEGSYWEHIPNYMGSNKWHTIVCPPVNVPIDQSYAMLILLIVSIIVGWYFITNRNKQRN